jgi:hypothetical protein
MTCKDKLLPLKSVKQDPLLVDTKIDNSENVYIPQYETMTKEMIHAVYMYYKSQKKKGCGSLWTDNESKALSLVSAFYTPISCVDKPISNLMSRSLNEYYGIGNIPNLIKLIGGVRIWNVLWNYVELKNPPIKYCGGNGFDENNIQHLLIWFSGCSWDVRGPDVWEKDHLVGYRLSSALNRAMCKIASNECVNKKCTGNDMYHQQFENLRHKKDVKTVSFQSELGPQDKIKQNETKKEFFTSDNSNLVSLVKEMNEKIVQYREGNINVSKYITDIVSELNTIPIKIDPSPPIPKKVIIPEKFDIAVIETDSKIKTIGIVMVVIGASILLVIIIITIMSLKK